MPEKVNVRVNNLENNEIVKLMGIRNKWLI